MTESVSCWAITDVDSMVHVRGGAWEVSHAAKDGSKQCCTVIFSGPDARKRAEWYADYLRGEELLE
jgi:hypothetical protein